MAGIELATAYVSITSNTKGLGRDLISDLTGAGNTAGRQSGSAFSSGFGAITRGLGRVAFAGLAAGVGASAAALGYAAKKGVDFNATMEQSRTAFRVLLRDTKKADQALGDLFAYSAKTPFEFPEVAAAGRMFATVGLDIKKTIGWVGDLASVAPASAGGIEEVARAISRLKSGDFGESFERLRDFGISKTMLLGEGLVFDKSGQYKGSVDQALTAVEHIVRTRFGGMADAQSKTFTGMLSTLKDNVAMMFGGASKSLFDWMKAGMPSFSAWIESDAAPALKKVFGEITDALKGVDWGGLAANVREFADGLTGNPGAYGQVAQGIKDVGTSINGLGKEIGGAKGLGFWIRETFATLGEFATLVSGIADVLRGAFTGDWDLAAAGAKKVSDALWGTATAATGAEQAIYDATGKLIGWNIAPAADKEPNTTFVPVGQGIQDATGKLIGWNGTQPFAKTVTTNFPTASSNIGTATGSLEGWNTTPAAGKTVKTNFGTVSGVIDEAIANIIRWNQTDIRDKTATVKFRSVESGSGTPVPTSAAGNRFDSPAITQIAEAGYTEWAITSDPRYKARSQRFIAEAAAENDMPLGGATFARGAFEGAIFQVSGANGVGGFLEDLSSQLVGAGIRR